MLLDGYWKTDLKSIIRQLERWSGKHCMLSQDFAEHKVNQGLLLSAVIIRKIVEDEKGGKKTYDKYWTDKPPFPGTEKCVENKDLFAILKCDIPVLKYHHIDEEQFFMNSKLILSDYDTKNAEKGVLPLDQICNQLIHSYVWGIIHTSTQKQIYGVMMASDHFMKSEAYLLKIDDWADAIRFVIDNSTI